MTGPGRQRLAVLSLVVALVVAGCTADDADDAAPEPIGPTSSTTTPPDFSTVPLAAVGGATTTTLALRPGDVVIGGVVTGPDGPVPGATVEITRLVGSGEVTERFLTLDDGRWEANGILGGRYRIRAWRAPDLALTTPEIRFLQGDKAELIPLTVTRYSGLAMTATFAPQEPQIGELVNLVVQLVDRQVDAGGVVRAVPRPAAGVELLGSSAWETETANPTRTNGAGLAKWTLRCNRGGVHQLSVSVEDERTIPVQAPACGRPATTTTAPPPSSTTSTTSPDDDE